MAFDESNTKVAERTSTGSQEKHDEKRAEKSKFFDEDKKGGKDFDKQGGKDSGAKNGMTFSDAKSQLSDDLSGLREDATKLISDITGLSSRITDAGKAKTQEITTDLMASLQEDYEALKYKMELLNESLKDKAKIVDGNVRKNPYIYIGSALGVGFLISQFLPVGKMFSGRRN